ncbi:MAG: F0F1 ATP synthase subunit gamma [Candidatus Cloacimonetes bacterium]|jgi:F-type H+-transporting ATPase subunit gamma|nr:F0F1 ATP synthase subunit gamma [Candidatus Cloacimonadota bacterium]MDY0171429.1 FoF1 ATP synthase subunit gamma [Candidatus Cloacimonadaceae bacterium]
MPDTIVELGRKIDEANDLHSVVRTLKTLSASRLIQYDRAEEVLEEFDHFVRLALKTYLGSLSLSPGTHKAPHSTAISHPLILAFGSGQGLVGKFDEMMLSFLKEYLTHLPGEPQIWTVGERLAEALDEHQIKPSHVFPVPSSIKGIDPLVEDILAGLQHEQVKGQASEFHLLYNAHTAGAQYHPEAEKLLPLDSAWIQGIHQESWPTNLPAEAIDSGPDALKAVLDLHLYSAVFRICVESFASENASRLATMQRAERNISDLLQSLGYRLNAVRQESIDAELFDVISGYEALTKKKN